MYGITYNPGEESLNLNYKFNPDLEKSWSNVNTPKLTPIQETVISESKPTEVIIPEIKKLEVGYLDPLKYNITVPKISYSSNTPIRKELEDEMTRRGLDETMKTFLRKSAMLESGMQLSPSNIPTGFHTGGAHKGKQFKALGMWQILDTNLKGLPINDEKIFMSNLSNQMENVLAMHKQSRDWLRTSGYLQKGLNKGYTEDELMYLMHHGWTGAVKSMIDENKSIGDVVNGADKGTAYTLNKYKQLKID